MTLINPQHLELIVENLTCFRSSKIILHNIYFTILSGQILNLSGYNGCGKSTLLATLAGLLPNDSGRIIINRDGKSNLNIYSELIWMGVRSPFYPQLSVHQNLLLWATIYGSEKEDVDQVIKYYGLISLKNYLTKTLSRGQLQRLALCRVKLSSKLIWLLDEPLTGLDLEGIALFYHALQQFLLEGGIVITASPVPLTNSRILNVEQFSV